MSDDSATEVATDSDLTDRAAQSPRSNGETNAELTIGSRDIRTLLNYAALALFVLFALVSIIQLYGAVGGMINELVSREYRDFFRAAFNLTVLLLCIGGISLQLKRIYERVD